MVIFALIMEERSSIKSPYRLGAEQGRYFGLYLSVWFLTMVLSLKVPILGLLNLVLSLGVPVMIYVWLYRRHIIRSGKASFSELWMQGIMVFLCGAVILSLLCVVYLRWIDPQWMTRFVEGAIVSYSKFYEMTGSSSAKEVAEVLTRMLETRSVPSASTMAVALFWMTTATGCLTSMIVAGLVKLRKIRPPRFTPSPSRVV